MGSGSRGSGTVVSAAGKVKGGGFKGGELGWGLTTGVCRGGVVIGTGGTDATGSSIVTASWT